MLASVLPGAASAESADRAPTVLAVDVSKPFKDVDHALRGFGDHVHVRVSTTEWTGTDVELAP